jgi:GalNAc-alpha-(1->4)-GalNAc-alpha-(1->3)-diNAcBac-PP-undecaprenol alpha-1,4-N-acetyl-D-galactosaminyltransferase
MKVVFFIHSLRSGGAERVLSLLANDWLNYGHDITIAVNDINEVFYPVNTQISIIDIGVQHKGIAKGITANIARVRKIKQTITDTNPDIVISFMTTMNIKVTLASKLAKKPIIISERTSFDALKSRAWRTLRRVIYPHSSALIVQTAQAAKSYDFLSNLEIIENPLILQNKHLNLKREKIILAVGTLYSVKGFDMLIDAFSKLRNLDDWKLVILGEGEDREKLEDQIKQLDLSKKVLLPGTVSDVEFHYKKASIFVLSSRTEGFPNALCESMANGCPSIAFDCLTGPSEIINHPHNGILVEAENIPELTQAMQELADNPEKRNSISKESKKLADRLSINTISSKWFETIDRVRSL